MEHTSNNPFERNRSGGSSGLMEYNKHLLQMLHVPNSSPKRSQGVIALQDKDNLSIHLFYLNKKQGEPKHFAYTTPVEGGKIKLNFEKFDMKKKFSFFQKFYMARLLAAKLLFELKGTLNQQGLPYQICPEAVSIGISQGRKAKEFVDRLYPVTSKNLRQHVRLYEYYKYYAEKFCKNTIVLHPVGMHIDHFPDNPVLENRMCFWIESDRFGDYGRGGAGLSKKSFAILDW